MEINIQQIIESSVKELNQTLSEPVILEKGDEVILYGAGGVLDSLALVNLIVNIESQIEEQSGVSLILANEKALSQKNSPFATLGKLKNYVFDLYHDEKTL